MSKRITGFNLPLSEFAKIRGHMCAWEGCQRTTSVDKLLPKGWRWLVLFRDSERTPSFVEMLSLSDRDCCLCPTHAGQLHNELLKDIGQRLGKTEGSA